MKLSGNNLRSGKNNAKYYSVFYQYLTLFISNHPEWWEGMI